MASVRYLGHSGFEVSWGSHVVYFDPWLELRPKEEQRLIPPAITSDRIRKADLIFVSHEHHDHCDPAAISDIVSRTFAQVVAPEETLARIDIPPRYRVAAMAGDNFTVMGINVSVVPAKHPQSVHPVGFIIDAGGKKIYFAGDTYDFYEMSTFDVDLAMLPIGGMYTMDSIAAVKAVKMMRTDFAIPMHYGTFARIQADADDFAKRLKGTKTQPVVLGVGETFQL
ncbi:Beta-lactamase superfamily domain protein [Candidatus Norongarragalina meridionalis]|nr:Beta-lactamase superfamily domain protein [Candidatus Norongarragalina meridionalis]